MRIPPSAIRKIGSANSLTASFFLIRGGGVWSLDRAIGREL
jgi:hypothetical protein